VGIIIAVFLIIIAAWVVMGVVAVHEGHQIAQHGLKSVIEGVWCGPGKHCL
jgi:hypothetical protein